MTHPRSIIQHTTRVRVQYDVLQEAKAQAHDKAALDLADVDHGVQAAQKNTCLNNLR